jgi:hypothetical protein
MRSLILLCCFASLVASTAWGQSSSSVKGTAVDPSGAAVPGVACTLSSPATGVAYRTTTDSSGNFVFPTVLAGSYDLILSGAGFQTMQYTSIVVTASQVRSLGSFTLQVGAVRESVQVTADVVDVQLASSEKSGLITPQQLNDIAVRGRDFFSVLTTVPGVLDTSARRETIDSRGSNTVTINGLRANQKNMQVDGVTEQDVGDNNGMTWQPNMDSVAEIKVLTSNYQAEFGRAAGGVIQLVIKGGSKSFHGSVYDYYRHESLNANNFFNNRSGTPKSLYRYRITGYSLGGPVYIPGKFNQDRDKLFFFWSQEYIGSRVPFGNQFSQMPTALERLGNFSQSYDVNGKLIPITDPLTKAPFPGNVIPQSRFNQYGQAILNFLPRPNYSDPDPNNAYRWNYYVSGVYPWPKRQDIIRLDYNPRPTVQLTYRYGQMADKVIGWWGLNGSGATNFNYPASGIDWRDPGKGQMFRIVKTFSPSLVNEFTFGRNYQEITYDPVNPQEIDRSKIANIPQWYANNRDALWHGRGDENYIPNITFGSQPANTAAMMLHNNLPYLSQSLITSFTDSVSKVFPAHSIKAGIYVERTHKNHIGSHQQNYRGVFDFGRNVNNPFDTNDGYSNALLGVFNSYWESTARLPSLMRFWIIEYFLQDNWKVNKRLTLELGARFSHQPPTSDENHALAEFDPGLYSAAKAPALYRPTRDAAGNRVALDPLSGALAPAALIGLYVPGSGDPANGWAVAGKNGYPAGLYTNNFIFVAPRLGFAYDPFGNGRTAVRGGFGIFVNKPSGNTSFNQNGQPPVAYRPQADFGALDTFTQSAGALGPGSSQVTLFGNATYPYVMNYSFSIQRQIGNMSLDAAYTGNVSRHQENRYLLNSIPMYARFDPKNADPTQPGKPLADNFLRPYAGQGDIQWQNFSASANYNAFQLSLTRRYTKRLEFGLAYSFSKVLGTASDDGNTVSSYFPARTYNYGPLSINRTHVVSFNYMYDLPRISTLVGVKPVGWILDDWQISGMAAFQSGAPFTPAFSTTDGADITGSSDGPRIVATCDPRVSSGDRTYYRNFKTECFQRPATRSFGAAAPGLLYGPGINNWDFSASKRIPLGSEQRYIRFRAEMFNMWNHTQFATYYTAARFDATGKQVDPNFGAYASARDPRIMQFSLKVVF